MIWTWYAEHIR